jgi:single-stranded-DNA-specific exonuclease
MYEHMCHVSHLFSKFGGHAMAAGLSLAGEDVEELRRELNADAGLSPEDLTEKIRIDVPMPLTYISEPLIQQLSLLEPCGNGNEKPIFADRGLRARRAFFIGRERRMLKLSLFCGNGTMDALYFGDAEEFLDYYREKYGQNQVDALLAGRRQDISFDFIYYPQVNEYQGMRSLQIVISHYR